MNSTPITDAERKILEHAISAEISRCFDAIRAIESAPVETALREHIKALEELTEKVKDLARREAHEPTKIVIEVAGGLVQAVHCTDPGVVVALFDYDSDEDGGTEQSESYYLKAEGPFTQVF